MKLFTTKKDIIAAIEDIRSTGKKLDNMIQTAACSVIQHLDKHGDVTLINSLVDAMPKGSRVNALRAFIETFAKVLYNEETSAFEYDKAGVTMLDDALATMWTEFKPEQPYQAMDLSREIQKLLKKATDRMAQPNEADKIDPVLVAKLQAMTEQEVAH